MSNGSELCCLTGVCCPAGSAEQRAAWIKGVQHLRPHLTETEAEAAADRILAAHGSFADIVAYLPPPAA